MMKGIIAIGAIIVGAVLAAGALTYCDYASHEIKPSFKGYLKDLQDKYCKD